MTKAVIIQDLDPESQKRLCVTAQILETSPEKVFNTSLKLQELLGFDSTDDGVSFLFEHAKTKQRIGYVEPEKSRG